MFENRIEKFVVEATALTLNDGQSYDISPFITDINVKKNFITTSFPLVVINIMATQRIRDILRDNEVAIKLKVSKYNNINQETTQDTESIVLDDLVFNTVIRAYSKPFPATATKTEEADENTTNAKDTTKAFPYQITGIPEELIQKNKTVINEVYSNAKMDEVLANILSTVENGSIFIDPSDNVTREESIIVPPLNIVPAIKYLQDIYGIYNAGLSIFFDFDGTYLTKIFSTAREYANTLEIVSVSGDDNLTDISYTTPMIDENNNVKLKLTVPPPFISNMNITMDSVGQTMVFNSYDYNYDVIKRIYNNNTDHEKTRYFWNQYQNKLFEESYINESLRTSEGIMVNIRNINPNYFKINTLYTLNTPTNIVNGEYILTEMTYILSTRDYKSYESLVNLKLAKK